MPESQVLFCLQEHDQDVSELGESEAIAGEHTTQTEISDKEEAAPNSSQPSLDVGAEEQIIQETPLKEDRYVE